MAEGPLWQTRRTRPKQEPREWRDPLDDTTYLDDNLEVRGTVTADGVVLGAGGGLHPSLAVHDALGLATDAEQAAHLVGDPHTVYATNAELDLHTAGVVDVHDAVSVSILDLAGTFTATEVETALAELTADDVAHVALPNAHHAEFTNPQHDALANPHHSNANDHAAAHALDSANHSAGTLGDVLYAALLGAWARLAGNTTSNKKFLTQTGTGVVSAAPAWAAIVDGDIPGTHSGSAHHAQSHAINSGSDHTGTLDDAQIPAAITRDAEINAIDFLVGTAQGFLSGEIVVGTTPGGELGNTWASPTVDASHSGSTHAATQAAAEATASTALGVHAAAADPHTGYRLESADMTHQSAGLQGGTLDHGLALTGLGDDDHPQYATNAEFDSHHARHEPNGADHSVIATGTYAAGSVLIPTGQWALVVNKLTLTGSQSLTGQGTAALRGI